MRLRITYIKCAFALLVFTTGHSKAQWSTIALSTDRSFFAATSNGSKVFFAGGVEAYSAGTNSAGVDIYDIESNTWTIATLSSPKRDLSAASVGTKVLFAGGTNTGIKFKSVDIYDIASNTWTTAELSEGRYSLVATTAMDKVFFAGGAFDSDVVDIYDNVTDSWSTTKLSVGRFRFTATSAGTKVFFAGGEIGSETYSDVVDIYDLKTDSWTTSKLSQPRAYLASASVGNKVLFAGGRSQTGPSDVVDIYDFSADTWTTTTLSAPIDRCAAASIGNRAFFNGGEAVEIYNNDEGTWTNTTIPIGKLDPSVTAARNKVFFAGGPFETIYVYDIECLSQPTVNVTDSATICEGESVTLTASEALTYSWSPTTGLSSGSGETVVASPITTTAYLVEGKDANGCVSTTTTLITVKSSPPKPDVSFVINSGIVILTSSITSDNQWYKDNELMPNEKSQSLIVNETGLYTAKIIRDGCTSSPSNSIPVAITDLENRIEEKGNLFYPNPVENKLRINWSGFDTSSEIDLNISDLNGKEILHIAIKATDDTIDISSLKKGIYLLIASQKDRKFIQRLIKD